MTTVIDDIKRAKGYILGLIAFATGVGTFLVQVLHFKLEPTILAVTAFAILILMIGGLINNSERRQAKSLSDHEAQADEKINNITNLLNELKDISIENQRSGLRLEMNSEMARCPENHDTILRMAERYFCGLSGDWVQTDAFLDWVDSEKAKGRTVHVPASILKNVETKNQIERATAMLREQKEQK